MTGFKSKKTAALDEDGMYLVHQTDHSEVVLNMVSQPAQEPISFLAQPLAQPWVMRRKWVDLTEKQIEVIEEIALTKQWAIRMTIAQLKECNK